jgi:hypothetical protein
VKRLRKPREEMGYILATDVGSTHKARFFERKPDGGATHAQMLNSIVDENSAYW